MLKHYLIVQGFFCEIVNVIRGISLSQKNSAVELKCNQGCGSQQRTMLLIAQLLKCQLVFYMLQEKFWKINFYWWYYQNSYCCYHVADKWIFRNQKKLGLKGFSSKTLLWSCLDIILLRLQEILVTKSSPVHAILLSFTVFQHKLQVFCMATMGVLFKQ